MNIPTAQRLVLLRSIEESRKRWAADVLKNELGFNVRNLFAGRERRHREVTEVVRVSGPHVGQKVDRTGYVRGPGGVESNHGPR